MFRENIRVKLALDIPAGTLITLVKEVILIPPLAADKAIAAMYLLSCLRVVFLSWIIVFYFVDFI